MTLHPPATAPLPAATGPTFVERIVEVARRHPDAVAVEDASGGRTYTELLTSAARVAGHLLELGTAPGDRVALEVARGCDAVAALLGVLLAGAVYVPLDPAYPAARREHMVTRAGCRVLVTSRADDDLALPAGCTRTSLDEALRGPVLQAPVARAGGDSAYVLFTSGSTGVPKGVEITLANATVLMDWAVGVVEPADVVHAAATVSLSFDLSVWDLYVPLLLGGTLRFFANALDPALASSRTTTMTTTPSVLQELLRGGRLPATLRTVLICGETLSETLARAFLEAFPQARILHAYGPTEAAVFVSCQDLRAGFAEVTLGRPLPGARLVLLDADRHEVPDGPGELCIGGPQVGVGYVGEPGLTAERFIDWQDASGAPVRLYRTGDKAARGEDGELRFLGRLDRQVKLRGFRVELEEVEQVLRAQPGLADVTVLVAGEGTTARLVAFGTAAAAPAGTTAEHVLAGVRQALPVHMVPSALHLLDRMPTTTSGKVDQVALRAVLAAAPVGASGGGAEDGSGGGSAEALVGEELAVAELVARVLRLPVLPGADDQVMEDLGATSLQLVEIHTALAERRGGGPDLGILMADTTVAALAARGAAAAADGADALAGTSTGGASTGGTPPGGASAPAGGRPAAAPGGSWLGRALRRARG